jgi:hypothetical protein
MALGDFALGGVGVGHTDAVLPTREPDRLEFPRRDVAVHGSDCQMPARRDFGDGEQIIIVALL